MCRYCTDYGNGTKWYLNPDNYRTELYEAEGHNVAFEMLTGADKNTWEVGAASDSEGYLNDYNYPGEFNMALVNRYR